MIEEEAFSKYGHVSHMHINLDGIKNACKTSIY